MGTLIKMISDDNNNHSLLVDDRLLLRCSNKRIVEHYYEQLISPEWGDRPYEIELAPSQHISSTSSSSDSQSSSV